MARLIDSNDVYSLFDVNGFARLHVADIDAIPRVDAVEVVRCKDCKNNGQCSIQDAMNWGKTAANGENFCSYGERKDGDEE